ncbi:hypothetical protein N9N67_09565 [Bacteriovoracaceae bacterium]|nr:hypothetical protein [Bacteriovoracaceae bacterium]
MFRLKLFLSGMIFLISNTYSAQFAVVKSEKAIVYADYKLSSPLGFLIRGKKLRVGEAPKYRGRSLPFILNGRVAYIATKDIDTSYDLSDLRSIEERVKTNRDKTINRISFNYSTLNATLFNSEALGDTQEEQIFMMGPTVKGHILGQDRDTELQIDLGFLTGANEDASLTTFHVSPAFSYAFYYKEKVKAFYGVGLNWFPHAQFGYKNYFMKNGTGYGAFTHVDMRYMVQRNWEFIFNLNYQYNLLDIDLPDGFYVDEFEPLVTGVGLSLGLVYLY